MSRLIWIYAVCKNLLLSHMAVKGLNVKAWYEVLQYSFGKRKSSLYMLQQEKNYILWSASHEQSIIRAIAFHSYTLKYPIILLTNTEGPDQIARMSLSAYAWRHVSARLGVRNDLFSNSIHCSVYGNSYTRFKPTQQSYCRSYLCVTYVAASVSFLRSVFVSGLFCFVRELFCDSFFVSFSTLFGALGWLCFVIETFLVIPIFTSQSITINIIIDNIYSVII